MQNEYLSEQAFFTQNKANKYKTKYTASRSKPVGIRSSSKAKSPHTKFFEDVGKSNTHKANLVVDGATPEQLEEEKCSDKDYTSDEGGIFSDTSESE